LIDVCGAALGLERLGVERVLATPPLVGSGTFRCAHGEMPVPAPATAELLRGRAHVIGGGGERLTPTAAALLRAWSEPRDMDSGALGFLTERVGYGAGTKDFPSGPPNLLRVQLGTVHAAAGERAAAWLLEVNLDDATPQEVGHALGRLRAAGALEAWTVPVQMKKDRPGVVLTALARSEDRHALEAAVFGCTPTFGLRWRAVERRECRREAGSVVVDGEVVRVKVRAAEGDVPRLVRPESDDVVRVADRWGISWEAARDRVLAAWTMATPPPTSV
jgi:uncharacterized protein (DUF111 family)